MKRYTALCLLVLVLFCGCVGQPSTSSAPGEGESVASIAPTEVDLQGMLPYREDAVYLDPSADLQGKLALYTNAEPLNDGTFAFDDRNDWMVLWEFDGKNYPILPRTALNLGDVAYKAWVDMDTGLLHLLLTVSQSASLTAKEYIFYPQEETFQVQEHLTADNINLWV